MSKMVTPLCSWNFELRRLLVPVALLACTSRPCAAPRTRTVPTVPYRWCSLEPCRNTSFLLSLSLHTDPAFLLAVCRANGQFHCGRHTYFCLVHYNLSTIAAPGPFGACSRAAPNRSSALSNPYVREGSNTPVPQHFAIGLYVNCSLGRPNLR